MCYSVSAVIAVKDAQLGVPLLMPAMSLAFTLLCLSLLGCCTDKLELCDVECASQSLQSGVIVCFANYVSNVACVAKACLPT